MSERPTKTRYLETKTITSKAGQASEDEDEDEDEDDEHAAASIGAVVILRVITRLGNWEIFGSMTPGK